MGIQAHADDAERIGVEVIKSGIIGKVREVHAWTDRPAWPQECERPKEAQIVPSTLRWDLWIGPAEFRPFNRAYHDFRWRGWWDFGTGALGDMGCHVIDPAFWALDLKYPISVESVRTELGWWQDTTFPETGPIASVIRLEFPARGDQPPVTLTWYDGGLRPLRPEEMEEGRNLPGNGVLYVGDKGKILSPYEQGPRLLPESKMKDFKPPEPTLPRGKDNYKEWLDACKGGTPGLANFDYAGPLTETVLLGVVALRAHPGKKFTWDGEKMKVTNDDNANEYIYPHYKNGWTL
jgi:predicted dehydrogenase